MNGKLGIIAALMVKATDGIVELRNIFRERGDYQIADEIRSNLGEMGISLRDTPAGTIWEAKH